MILGAISDTHNHHSNKWEIQPCDVLIHCGDFSFQGNFSEVQQFVKDFKKAKKDSGAKYAIIVPGNHEKGVQANEQFFREYCEQNDIIVLIHEEIVLDGVRFFGTPWQPYFCNWAYNVENEQDLDRYYSEIPDDTQVLITHCPPYKILDYSPMCGNVGSKELQNRVMQLKKLKFHFFGHIHYSQGFQIFHGIKFVNCAILGDQYGLNPEGKRMQVFEYETT